MNLCLYFSPVVHLNGIFVKDSFERNSEILSYSLTNHNNREIVGNNFVPWFVHFRCSCNLLNQFFFSLKKYATIHSVFNQIMVTIHYASSLNQKNFSIILCINCLNYLFNLEHFVREGGLNVLLWFSVDRMYLIHFCYVFLSVYIWFS